MKLNRQIKEILSTAAQFVGVVGLIYEMVIDKFKHPEALGVFGGLAGMPDILGLTATAKRRRDRENRRNEEE